MQIAHSPEVITAYQPRTGAIESMNSFISMGYEVAIVTGRPTSSKQLTEEWLAKHNISFHHLLFVDKYSRVIPNAANSFAISLEALAEINFCFAVEDSSDMARLLSEDMQIPVALLDRPWNRNWNRNWNKISQYQNQEAPNLVNRCHTWDEVMETFLSRKQNKHQETKN